MGNKEERERVELLAAAARKTLAYAKRADLPPGLGAMIASTYIPDMLRELVRMCDFVLGKKLSPRRTDGRERMLAAEEAILLLPRHIKSLKRWQELLVILYGTNDVDGMRWACRRFRVWQLVDLAQKKAKLERLRAELVEAEAEHEVWLMAAKKRAGRVAEPGENSSRFCQ